MPKYESAFTKKSFVRLMFLEKNNLCARCEQPEKTKHSSFCYACLSIRTDIETFVTTERFEKRITEQLGA